MQQNESVIHVQVSILFQLHFPFKLIQNAIQWAIMVLICITLMTNSGSWWWTGKPGVLQFMGSQSRTRLSDWTEWLVMLSIFSCTCWVHAQSLSRVQLFATPWTVAHQAPLSMEFFQARILEWVAFTYSRDSWPRDQTRSLASPALAGGFVTTSTTWETCASSLQKSLLKSFANFFSAVTEYIFNIYCIYSLYIFWILIPYQIHDSQILLFSAGCLFTLLIVSFDGQKFLIWWSK